MHKKLSTIADIDTEVSHDKWLTGDAAEEVGFAEVAQVDDDLGYVPSEEDAYSF